MKRSRTAVALCCAGLVLGGCAATEKLVQGRDGSATLANLLAFNSTSPGPAPAATGPREAELKCPPVDVLEGTAAYRTYAGAEQSNGNVRYQYSMGDVARECSKAGNQILIKVGVEGRVLLGPAGSSGSFTVPVRIAVRREADGKAAAAKIYQVPASITAGSDATGFQLVSDPIAVPYLRSNADDDYTILVGFDAATPSSALPGRTRRRGSGARPAAPPAAAPPPG